jgi:hypothetical protein
MRHANPLVWRGDLLVWGLTGFLASRSVVNMKVFELGTCARRGCGRGHRPGSIFTH